uniref:Uncharacterized protein n=1 Tax=Steinernema glaseri TaxID=37863 RepID=A0A1I7Y3T8_9BILA
MILGSSNAEDSARIRGFFEDTSRGPTLPSTLH